MTQIATLLVCLFVFALFWLNRKASLRTSIALWLPVVWLSVAGSRPVSAWLQIKTSTTRAVQYVEGSPFDRNFWLVLLIAGLLVLGSRYKAVWNLVRSNPAATAFLLYCAASILWSDFPNIAFKRWTKFLGDYVMVMIVLTDRSPATALKRVLTRLSFVLLPLSILLVKYYPELGRSYAQHWASSQFFTGVTQDKNMLGMTCLVCGVGGAWLTLEELAGARRWKSLLSCGCIFAMALWLLFICDSKTSLCCLLLVSVFLTLNTFVGFTRRTFSVHVMVAGAVLLCFALLVLGIGEGVIGSIGRDATLSGRTQLWADVLELQNRPILGYGFESFWLGSRLARLWDLYWFQPIEAHNGYLEIYANLGYVGLAAFACLIFSAYKNTLRLLRVDPEAGRIRLAYLIVGLTYNFTEAAIHTLNLVWIFLLLSSIRLPSGAKYAPESRRAPLTEEPWLAARVNRGWTNSWARQ